LNLDHVAILESHKAFKAWRLAHPGEWPDLSYANLSNYDLSSLDLRGADLIDSKLFGTNLSYANLNHANLSCANLTNADLRDANLNHANLSCAKLLAAKLSRADLRDADLSRADLRDADLSHAKLGGAKLDDAELFGAKLGGADLRGADLSCADLRDADLRAANLRAANLRAAYLRNANFFGADLIDSNLRNANLNSVDLRGSKLVRASLAHAELTGAKLYGTARDDWKIRDVRCNYVFWDQGGKERSPKDRDLAPGEFELLYTQLPIIEYVFEDGMTPLDLLVMDRVVHAINERTPEFDLQIDSINARGLQPTIKFIVRHEEQKDLALAAVEQGYKAKIRELEAQKQVLCQLIAEKLDSPQKIYLTNAQPGSLVAIDGSSINIEEYIHHLEEIEKAIEDIPPETLTEIAKRTALDIVSGALKDLAKGKVKEAAERIYQLGLQVVPSIVNTPAYEVFKNLTS
jgi:uncharacterized protein YjbI with pentapeptide repeats